MSLSTIIISIGYGIMFYMGYRFGRSDFANTQNGRILENTYKNYELKIASLRTNVFELRHALECMTSMFDGDHVTDEDELMAIKLANKVLEVTKPKGDEDE